MKIEGRLHGLTLSGRTLLIVPIVLLMLVSWAGVLDKISKEYVDGALAKAVVAFGTARAINGAVSVAQSTTVSVGFGAGVEVSPGEVLDPINDLVEDYSSVMKMAIVSLVIQKILLTVVSEGLFKVLLTLSGLALITTLLLKAATPMNFAFRVFVSLVFLRFILVAVVVVNGLVNHAFIDDHKDAAMARLDVLPADLEQQSEVGATSMPERYPAAEALQLQTEVGTAKNALKESRSLLEAIKSKRSLTDTLNPFRDDQAYDAAAAAVDVGETKLNALLVRRCDAMRRAADPNADAACEEVPLAARARTMAASAGQAISAAAKVAAAAIDVPKLRQKVEGAVTDMITSMALFILQTMILPLLFLFLLSKAAKSIWGMNLKEMVAKSRVAVAQGIAAKASGLQ